MSLAGFVWDFKLRIRAKCGYPVFRLFLFAFLISHLIIWYFWFHTSFPVRQQYECSKTLNALKQWNWHLIETKSNQYAFNYCTIIRNEKLWSLLCFLWLKNQVSIYADELGSECEIKNTNHEYQSVKYEIDEYQKRERQLFSRMFQSCYQISSLIENIFFSILKLCPAKVA